MKKDEAEILNISINYLKKCNYIGQFIGMSIRQIGKLIRQKN